MFYIQLRYHELTQPLQRERGELERSVVGLSEQLATREKELRSCQNVSRVLVNVIRIFGMEY